MANNQGFLFALLGPFAVLLYFAKIPYQRLVDYVFSILLNLPLAGLVADPSFPFVCLFVFRYLRLVVHIFSFCYLYTPTPIPAHPTLTRKDCSVVLPTVDPSDPDFKECVEKCLINRPGELIVVTPRRDLAALAHQIIAPYQQTYPETNIQVHFGNIANKRFQVGQGITFVTGKITVLLDDHVFWRSANFLPTILAPFENDKVGAVGTNKRVRRTATGLNAASFWNMLGALYLERHNFEIRATNAIDGGVFVVSGRTAAYRTEILQSPAFLNSFCYERFFFGMFGPLNADDDNYLTRQIVRRGYDIKIQYCPDALIETTLGTYPRFLSQCLRWVRTTWRSNTASLITDRTVWRRQPWCVYAVYLTSFVNFALFYDAALIYTLSRFADRKAIYMLLQWIFCTKMVKLIPYFIREPQDLLMLPGYFLFAYYHSLIKLYAGLTFWDIAWSGRNLDAVNPTDGDDSDDDGFNPYYITSSSHSSDPSSSSGDPSQPPWTATTPWGHLRRRNTHSHRPQNFPHLPRPQVPRASGASSVPNVLNVPNAQNIQVGMAHVPQQGWNAATKPWSQIANNGRYPSVPSRPNIFEKQNENRKGSFKTITKNFLQDTHIKRTTTIRFGAPHKESVETQVPPPTAWSSSSASASPNPSIGSGSASHSGSNASSNSSYKPGSKSSSSSSSDGRLSNASDDGGNGSSSPWSRSLYTAFVPAPVPGAPTRPGTRTSVDDTPIPISFGSGSSGTRGTPVVSSGSGSGSRSQGTPTPGPPPPPPPVPSSSSSSSSLSSRSHSDAGSHSGSHSGSGSEYSYSSSSSSSILSSHPTSPSTNGSHAGTPSHPIPISSSGPSGSASVSPPPRVPWWTAPSSSPSLSKSHSHSVISLSSSSVPVPFPHPVPGPVPIPGSASAPISVSDSSILISSASLTPDAPVTNPHQHPHPHPNPNPYPSPSPEPEPEPVPQRVRPGLMRERRALGITDVHVKKVARKVAHGKD